MEDLRESCSKIVVFPLILEMPIFKLSLKLKRLIRQNLEILTTILEYPFLSSNPKISNHPDSVHRNF